MPCLDISSVPVEFPFVPYSQQETLMTKLVASAQYRQNALVESPTGTGKTLCLLCALLAWRGAYVEWKKAIKNPDLQKDLKYLEQLHKRAFGENTPFLHDRDINEPIPKIYYASRTHSQLSQSVLEIKNTKYSPQTVVLGSRDQMCINPALSNTTSGAKSGQCKSLVKKNQCSYHRGSENIQNIVEYKHSIMDIEDLVIFGKTRDACPFYLAQNTQQEAHIIFLPYQYLIGKQTRESQKIDTNNSIIVFDEGHNVEGCCTEATSFDLAVGDLEAAKKELDMVQSVLHSDEIESEIKSFFNRNDFSSFKDCITNLISQIKSAPLSKQDRSASFPGAHIFTLLKKAGFDLDSKEKLSIIQLTIEYSLRAVGLSLRGQKKAGNTSGRHGLAILQTAFKVLIESQLLENEKYLKYYKVFIQEKEVTGGSSNSRPGSYGPEGRERVLSLWCFSSEVAMASLAADGCRSIILASGTLSPLDSFSREMGIPFPNLVENTHVISDNQIYVPAVSCGPTRQKLLSNYQNREIGQYCNELGLCIVNICRTVPDGVLVFFTSYYLLELYVNNWKVQERPGAKSIWDRISEIKYPLQEPRSKVEFGDTFALYEKTIQEKRGAVFFAVCRGKASEGIDFSDSKARAVVICGIPFPAFKDPRVMLKKELMNSGSTLSKRGEEWYTQQAFRSLNQAIGRVIRHRNDYGAIILLDQRFTNPRYQNSLPLWLRRQVVKYYDEYGRFVQDLGNFFKFHNGNRTDETLLRSKASASTSSDYLASTRQFEDPLQIISKPKHNPHSNILQVKKDLVSGGGKGLADDPLQMKSSKLTEFKEGAFDFKYDPIGTKKQPQNVQKANFKPEVANFADNLKRAASPSQSNEAKKAHTAELAKTFFDKLKGQFSRDEYNDYKLFMQKYKKKRYTQEQLIERTADMLFGGSNSSEMYLQRFQLFVTFGCFVSPKYDDFYQKKLKEHRPR